MKLVMTVMVRDEADVIAAMIEHHLAQGVDMIIATDNGSIDGTLEILEGYRDRGVLTLHQDPVHRKQQHSTVTTMAREAHTKFGADWVINADADEFWVTTNPAITLRTAFENISPDLQSFLVPVVDLTGLAATSGSGFNRLTLRDNRSDEAVREAGLLSHSTPNAVHVGRADIEVAQGNHAVNLASLEDPDAEWGIEVLHMPWRSWAQYQRKVENAGRAYEANTDLLPSPNHHGMRDYRRLQDGALLPFYLLRHPTQEAIDVGLLDGSYSRETRLTGHSAHGLPDVLLEPTLEAMYRTYGEILLAAENRQHRTDQDLRALVEHSAAEKARLTDALVAANVRAATLETTILHFRARRVVRLADTTSRLQHATVDLVSKVLKK